MPAINHPRLSAPAAAHATTSARPATSPMRHGATIQHPATTQYSSLGRGGIRPATLAESDFVASPFCERCGTDEFIYLETFIPAAHRRDGSVSKLGEVTYFCSGCDDFSAHAVPASWVPPGWYFG
ncbi:hypothetical protein GCM10009825_00260 [Arthrobacter humicola]|uniref:Uncharacterized protein n=2 Tax=Arthrobacter TaxID=1663 RepID=A0ABN2YB96_9MICC